jgi:hypothetical protein
VFYIKTIIDRGCCCGSSLSKNNDVICKKNMDDFDVLYIKTIDGGCCCGSSLSKNNDIICQKKKKTKELLGT